MQRAMIAAAGALALGAAGCGSGTDYENRPRPPAPVNVTASISGERVSLSPRKIGAGPIVLVVTNQTGSSQQLTIETDEVGSARPGITQSTGPINPQATATLKVDVPEGAYKVHVDEGAGIAPARLAVGRQRPSAQNELLQP